MTFYFLSIKLLDTLRSCEHWTLGLETAVTGSRYDGTLPRYLKHGLRTGISQRSFNETRATDWNLSTVLKLYIWVRTGISRRSFNLQQGLSSPFIKLD